SSRAPRTGSPLSACASTRRRRPSTPSASASPRCWWPASSARASTRRRTSRPRRARRTRRACSSRVMGRSLLRALPRALLLGLLLLPILAAAQDFQAPRAPTRWATDTAGLLRPATVRQLDGVLQAYQRQSGHQVIFWVGRTTGGVPIEDWAVRTFEAWKIGREGQDDGIGIFLFAEDRTVR